jgi:hypothetical protein
MSGTLDDVEVTVGDGVEGARIDEGAVHGVLLRDAADSGTDGVEFLIDAFVAAVDVIDA